MHNTNTIVETQRRLVIEMPPEIKAKWTDDDLFTLCAHNKDVYIEQNADGSLVVSEPTGFYSGRLNMKISTQLGVWSEKTRLGEAFDSSTGFKLPNGAMKCPDASWITLDKWENLTQEQKEKLAPICPDFVVELRSRSDRIPDLQQKMEEYIANGSRLGWLIDPYGKSVYIYRLEKEMEIHDKWNKPLSGEDVLPGFELDLTELDE
jgi:Uma2 family endonuclease